MRTLWAGRQQKTSAGSSPLAEASSAAGAPGGSDTIAAWLDGFSRMMVASEAEKRETRAELESHLRDRSRDLMLAGLNADEAARRAIEELGGAAEIAASYRATRVETQRRQAMQVAGIGLAAGAAVVSIAALFQGAVGRASAPAPSASGPVATARERVDPPRFTGQLAEIEVVQPALANPAMADPVMVEVELVEPSELVVDRTYVVEFVKSDSGGLALREIKPVAAVEAQTVGATAAAGAFGANPVELEQYYEPMETTEIMLNTKITANLAGATLAEALEAIAAGSGGKVRVPSDRVQATMEPAMDQVSITREWKDATMWLVLNELNEGLPDSCRVEARDEGQYVELATARVFDARTMGLVAYRVSGVMAKAFAGEVEEEKKAEKLVQTLTNLVYKDDWIDNGGSIGEMRYAGGMLFVKAPERHQHKVAWILRKLETE